MADKKVKVRILQPVAGLNFSYAPGEETYLAAKTAKEYINNGIAEAVSKKAETEKMHAEITEVVKAEVNEAHAEAIAAEQLKTSTANAASEKLQQFAEEQAKTIETLEAEKLEAYQDNEKLHKQIGELKKQVAKLEKQVPKTK